METGDSLRKREWKVDLSFPFAYFPVCRSLAVDMAKVAEERTERSLSQSKIMSPSLDLADTEKRRERGREREREREREKRGVKEREETSS